MNKQGSPKLPAVLGVTLLAGSLGVFLMGQNIGQVRAAQKNGPADEIQKIADEFKNGKPEAAKKLAQALANKKGVDMDDVMDLLKPRKKGGMGVGKQAGAIVPDGIEQMLITLGRDAPGAATLAKQANDLEEMSYILQAVAEYATHKPPEKFTAKQTKKDWMAWSAEVRSGAAEFAKAAKAKGSQDVHSAAKKINAACNSCHTAFRN